MRTFIAVLLMHVSLCVYGMDAKLFNNHGSFAIQDTCKPVSTLPCSAITVALPYKLNFDTVVAGTIADKNGLGTGFTTINTYSGTRVAADGTASNVLVPGYEQSKITLSNGSLQLLTNKGIDYLNNNNLLNVLGVKINTVGKLQLEVKLIKPYNGTKNQQAGLWYGLNDKTFIKLSITGNQVEFRKELNDVSSTSAGTSNPDQRITAVISGLNNQTVTLRMVIDSVAGTAEGFYSTDGINFISSGAGYAVPGLNIAGMGFTAGTAYAGIYATHRNASTAVTYTFDDFFAINIPILNPPPPPPPPQQMAFCTPISTLPCDSIKISLPFALNFDSAIPNTLVDKNGQGTGFRTVNTYSGTRNAADGVPSNPQVPGYEPSKITLTSGKLQLVSNKGIDFQANNNLLNVLGVKTATARRLQIDVDVINPYNGTQSQQAGLWYGLNDKTFIKLDISGNKVELRREINDVVSSTSGTSSPDQRITTAISGLNSQTVRLRLVIDSLQGTAEGFYSTDGISYVSTGADYSSAGINITGMGIIDSAAYAGIYATHRNGSSAITYNFDNFSIKSIKVPIPPSLPGGAYMVLKNLDNFPADDQLVLSLIQKPWRRTSPDTTPYNANHDKAKLRINNKGTIKLEVSALTLSNTAAWKIVTVGSDSTASVPVIINPGSYVDVTVQFKAKDAASRIKVFNDTLAIKSNDDAFPLKKVIVHGIWQKEGEDVNEPYAQQIINAFGFTTATGYSHDDGSVNGSKKIPNSSEVDASYFVRADSTKPVKVIQMAAYHGCCAAVESFKYFTKGSTSSKTVFTHNPLDGQSVLPRLSNKSSTLAQGTFTPTSAFGIMVGSSSSDRKQNYKSLIGIRILKVYDSNGNLVPNAYFLDCDYLGNTYTNYDYQDNIYYVENVKPESGSVNNSELAAQPVSAVNFAPTLTGKSTSYLLTLKNLGMSYANGTSDPSINIKSTTISGSDVGEFELDSLSTKTIAIQQAATIVVRFRPGSVGAKNAVLLVSHDNSPVPLRIPLYGIANSSTSTVSVVKRIKGAVDNSVTIGNNLYESDKNYRKGSIKLDKQSVIAGIKATDVDSLYQTYLSAANELAETRYEIPLDNGDYQVRFHFAEVYWTAPGSRVFGINIENQPVLQNFDIFNEVGANSAIVKDFNTTVNDGVLNIKFNPTANRTAVAAVEIFKTAENSIQQLMAVNTMALTVKKNISVYPNPNTGNSFTLDAQNFSKKEKVLVKLLNMAGRVLQTHTFYTDDYGKANIYMAINTPLSTGVYIVNATTSSGILYTRLLVR